MFEKEAEERTTQYMNEHTEKYNCENTKIETDNYNAGLEQGYEDGFKDGAEFGYNKAKEDVKHDLMMKLKDEGIVKPLKDSILRNERLSSQEQQELCAWIECAMDFGENLDECAKELEEAKKANEWHYMKDVRCYEDLPQNKDVYYAYVVNVGEYDKPTIERRLGCFAEVEYDVMAYHVIAWKEIIPPDIEED